MNIVQFIKAVRKRKREGGNMRPLWQWPLGFLYVAAYKYSDWFEKNVN